MTTLCTQWQGAWVKAEREAQGLSQGQLARRCGLPQSAVSRLEKASGASFAHAALVLAALGLKSADELRARHGPKAEELAFDGPAVKQLRESRGLSANAVARRAGMSAKSLEAIEAAPCNPSMKIVGRILRALDVEHQTPRFLVFRAHGDPTPEAPRPTSEAAPPETAAPVEPSATAPVVHDA